MKTRFFLFAPILFFLIWFLSCGGSSGPALNNVNDIPSFNASDYDFSSGEAVEGLTRISAHSLETEVVGEFSRAACEAYTLKRRLFKDSERVEAFLCYFKKLENSNLGMTIPQGSYAYYQIQFSKPPIEGSGPPPNVRVRIGKINGQIRMDSCIPQNDVFTKESEVRIGVNPQGYTGQVVNEYSFQEYVDDANLLVSKTGKSKIEVSILGTSVNDYSSAEFNSYHQDKDSEGNGFTSEASFSADPSTQSNTISGAHSFKSIFWNSNEGKIFGQWGKDLVGSVKFSNSGKSPPPNQDKCVSWGVPQTYLSTCVGICYYTKEGKPVYPQDDGFCWFEHPQETQSFSIHNEVFPPSFSLISSETSPYFTVVSQASLPTQKEVETHLLFEEPWDCSNEKGFQSIDATSLKTVAKECEPEEDKTLWRMCEEQQIIDTVIATNPEI